MRVRAALLCLLLSVVAISADLQADIDDVTSHLPMKEIVSIGKQYVAADPGYADGLRYVEEVTYEQLIKEFLETKGGEALIEYFNQREIDAESIWLNMAKKTTGVIRKWLEPIEEGESLSPVISGNIMADYRKAIAASNFFEAVHKKMEESPEFANLIDALKDPEYHALFYRVANSQGLGKGKNPQARGFWKKVWKVTQAVAVGVAILG